ncbi:hypothetical protein DSAG12_00911 [Promethearchaeum syntrophicum]|uniref:Uncharacterized protein n=1 Tax=Promethearchaeum syntrophicum TaxID=2594042 RepID=A0A5B9D7D5_9ARCH|nr:hypothetical protein [Candidatus Prometheoarchaeum syntrophicum]QEE15088.1 hypothetical protein DSAG12_00911 [Candidatus Prometheoarchaeum syntrophicum]
MNIRDSFYITDLKIKNESQLEDYNPNLISHLSKQMYDEYLLKSKIYYEILEVLEIDNINQENIKEFLNKKINLTMELIKNTKNEEDIKKFNLIIEEYKNLIKLGGDSSDYKKQQ